jgi:hypothetical protein
MPSWRASCGPAFIALAPFRSPVPGAGHLPGSLIMVRLGGHPRLALLMRGDENGLGTPVEDLTGVAAVAAVAPWPRGRVAAVDRRGRRRLPAA